jgi:3alpha(or 20beta)-hydroxysteroid dehydrogenase
MGKLDGKVALISGAARGQGEAEARLFVEEGAKVVLGDVRDDLGKAVAESLGENAIYQHLDVSREEEWLQFVALAKETFGAVDVLVNNAGILLAKRLVDTSVEDFMRVIGINQVGCFLGIKSVVKAMQEAGGGSIVNISSVGGLTGVNSAVAYVSSKFAVTGITKTAALELGPLGIRVNSVHPGGVDTPMVTADTEGFEEEMGSQSKNRSIYDGIPLRRISQPIEIARLVAFLASDDSSYCTGSEFTADGGIRAGV